MHRAFSIFVFNKQSQLLLHKRASGKYHSGGLWTNTCCTHPRPDEGLENAIHRRLQEEMGFDTNLEKKFDFIYRATVGELTEHEFDHVYFGVYDKNDFKPDPQEVEETKWISIDDLQIDMKKSPEKYTAWFRILMDSHSDKVLANIP